MQQARAEGRCARAVYKLMQMDDKLKFLLPGKTVIDLGAAPGSWTELAVQRAQSLQGKRQSHCARYPGDAAIEWRDRD